MTDFGDDEKLYIVGLAPNRVVGAWYVNQQPDKTIRVRLLNRECKCVPLSWIYKDSAEAKLAARTP